MLGDRYYKAIKDGLRNCQIDKCRALNFTCLQSACIKRNFNGIEMKRRWREGLEGSKNISLQRKGLEFK